LSLVNYWFRRHLLWNDIWPCGGRQRFVTCQLLVPSPTYFELIYDHVGSTMFVTCQLLVPSLTYFEIIYDFVGSTKLVACQLLVPSSTYFETSVNPCLMHRCVILTMFDSCFSFFLNCYLFYVFSVFIIMLYNKNKVFLFHFCIFVYLDASLKFGERTHTSFFLK
jgi:hypothetical protein